MTVQGTGPSQGTDGVHQGHHKHHKKPDAGQPNPNAALPVNLDGTPKS